MNNPAVSSTAAESRALEIDGPQPVWMTLNEARERAFTGEIVFELDPEVYAYLDNGVVYYAERAGEAALGRRLLEAGLLDEAQLERGVVRVGDVEHLGRLFDRDQSVDRDAVLVLTELLTQDLITDLANREIATVRSIAYRHHPSGVHRWFVEPADAASAMLADMAQLGHTGRLSAIPAASDEALSDELRIEWDEPLGVFDDGSRSGFADFDVAGLESAVLGELLRGPAGVDAPDAGSVGAPPLDTRSLSFDDDDRVDPPHDDEPTDVEFFLDTEASEAPEPIEAIDVVPVDAGTGVANAAVVDDTETARAVAGTESVADIDSEIGDEVDIDSDIDSEIDIHTDEVAPAEGEFQVVWPDGSATDVSETAVEEMETAGVDETLALVHEDDGGFRFEMPPLTYGTSFEVSDDDVDSDDVPDDVADAVRRALAAIETATAESASIAPMPDPIGVADDVVDDASDDGSHDTGDPAIEWGADDVDDPRGEQHGVVAPVDVPGAEPSGEQLAVVDAPEEVPVAGPSSDTSLSAFAPPTPDMAAEAIYSREAAAARSEASRGAPAGFASVVFVDDDGHDDDGERTSALKRLIGSLRRKDR